MYDGGGCGIASLDTQISVLVSLDRRQAVSAINRQTGNIAGCLNNNIRWSR